MQQVSDAAADSPVTSYTRFIERADGSMLKVVAQRYVGSGLHSSVGVDIFIRNTEEEPWRLLDDRPAPGWKSMSRQEYMERGRSEVFRTLSMSEWWNARSTASMIGKPMSQLPAGTTVKQ